MTTNPQDFHSYQGLETPNTNPYDELWECHDQLEVDDVDECENELMDDEDLI